MSVRDKMGGVRSTMRPRSYTRPSRLVLALVILCAPTTIALAQPARSKGTAKPPTTSASTSTSKSKGDAGAATSDDGGATSASASDTPPAPPPESGDGGRLSPLNPQPQELPSNAVDAGVPMDYDRLLADIAALRARVAAVSDNLYRSRIAISLQTDGDNAKIGHLTVSLDDGVVFTAAQTFAASDMTAVYDHAVAPGRHAVTVDVDRRDARDEAFRTSQRSRFSVDVPRDNKVDVQVKIIDDSSMGADFPSDRSGKYDLRFRVKAVAKPVGK